MADADDLEAELATILEGIGEGFYAVDGQWRITRFNSAAARHFHRPAETMIGRVLWNVFPDAASTDLGKLFLDAMANRRHVVSETPSVVIDGPWLAYRLFPLKDGMGVVFRDVADRKRAEEQRDVLIRELNHRIKNTLSMAQALASQTLRAAKVDAEVRRALDARFATLGNVNATVTDPRWTSADLAAVVEAALNPHRLPGRDTIRVDGPDFRIRRPAAVALSMALHELCTNAAKYGALSADEGSVTLEWRLRDERFQLCWQERGGPAVATPQHKGFGSVLIEQVVSAELRGDARIAYDPAGVVFRIDAPLGALSVDAMAAKPEPAAVC